MEDPAGKAESAEVNVRYAYKLAHRYAKAAAVIIDTATGFLPAGVAEKPTAFSPVIVKQDGRLFCFYGIRDGKIDTDLISPFVTNASFSLELYMKVLLYRERGRWIAGHNLSDLFKKLSSESRDSLRRDFAAAMGALPAYKDIRDYVRRVTPLRDFDWDLDKLLAKGANAFVEWRYPFDKGVGWFVGFWELRDALVRQIELRDTE